MIGIDQNGNEHQVAELPEGLRMLDLRFFDKGLHLQEQVRCDRFEETARFYIARDEDAAQMEFLLDVALAASDALVAFLQS